MENSWFGGFAILLLGGNVGYLVGKNSNFDASRTPTENVTSRTRAVSHRSDTLNHAAVEKNRDRRNAEQIMHMPGRFARIQTLMDFYANLAPEQFAEEAKKLSSSGLSLQDSMTASDLLFGRWVETDPMAAMAYAITAERWNASRVFQNWASLDPASAAKYYVEHPREFAMMDTMASCSNVGGNLIVATEWVRQDPTAAFAWVNFWQAEAVRDSAATSNSADSQAELIKVAETIKNKVWLSETRFPLKLARPLS